MKSVAYAVIHNAASRIAMFGIGLLAARTLTPDEFGQFSLISNALIALATIASLGGATATNIACSRNNHQSPHTTNALVWVNLLAAFIVSAAGVMITALLFSSEIPSTMTNHQLIIVLLGIAGISLTQNTVLEGTLSGLKAFKDLTRNSIGTTTIIIFAALIAIQEQTFTSIIILLCIFRILPAVLNTHSTYKSGLLRGTLGLDNRTLQEVRQSLININLPALASSIAVIPILTLAMALIAKQPNGATELAFFAWPYQLYLAATFIPNSLAAYHLSTYTASTNPSRRLRKVILTNAIYSTLAASSLLILEDPILNFAGEQYATHASQAYRALAFTIIFHSLCNAFGSYWPAVGLPWVGTISNYLWAPIVLFLPDILQLTKPSTGLAAALLIAYVFIFVMQMILFSIVKHNIKTRPTA